MRNQCITVFVETLIFHFDEDTPPSNDEASLRRVIEHIPIDKIMKHYKPPIFSRKPTIPHKTIYGFNVI